MQHGEQQARNYTQNLERVKELTREYFKWHAKFVNGKGWRLANVELKKRTPDPEWFWGEHLPNQMRELSDITTNASVYLSRANRAVAALKAGKPARVNISIVESRATTITPSLEVTRAMPVFEKRVLSRIRRALEDAKTLKSAFNAALAKHRG